jgi:CubicO group peptidase (beta-lactamase class C family)
MKRNHKVYAMLVGIALACGLACGGLGKVSEPDLERYRSGETQYPGEHWAQADDPGALGWDTGRLAEARALYDGLESAAFLAIHRGVVIASWGKVGKSYNAQSMRKSLLNALIGQEVEAGRVSLDATLGELGIDDESPPLDAEEKTATARDLLHTSSGVYHSALYEVGGWKRNKPERGSHPPGTFWYYSNWDFNTLGRLFELASGQRIGPAFAERLARPLEMQDFRAGDVDYLSRRSLTEKFMHNDSLIDAYVFMISARDLARFGLLFEQGGRWNGQQVVPERWVRQSWTDAVPIGEFEEWFGEGSRYGYLWWVQRGQQYGAPAGTHAYVAQGSRGHTMAVLPELDLVLVHRVATGGVGLLPQLKRRFLGSAEVSDADVEKLMGMVVAARPGG